MVRASAWAALSTVLAISTLLNDVGEKTSVNWTVIFVALIAAIPGTLAALAAMRAANNAATKAEKAHAVAEEVKEEAVAVRNNVGKIELSIDGFMAKYELKSDEAAEAKGIAQEMQRSAEVAAKVEVDRAIIEAAKAVADTHAAELRTPPATHGEVVREVVKAVEDNAETKRVADETAKLVVETTRIANAAEKKE